MAYFDNAQLLTRNLKSFIRVWISFSVIPVAALDGATMDFQVPQRA